MRSFDCSWGNVGDLLFWVLLFKEFTDDIRDLMIPLENIQLYLQSCGDV